MDYSLQQLEEKYKSLPTEIRQAMDSVEVARALEDLGKKYKLHIDKAGELSDETSMVMLGLTHPKDYLGNLKNRLEIPEDLAREIVADVNEQIFKPIRESLKKMHGIMSAGEAPLADTKPPAIDHPPTLNKTDEKIFAQAGIQMEKPPSPENLPVEETKIPAKAEILKTLENPSRAKEEAVGVPAGFTLAKISPTDSPLAKTLSGATPIPEQKLSGEFVSGSTSSLYAEKATPPTSPLPEDEKKYTVDPYREPAN